MQTYNTSDGPIHIDLYEIPSRSEHQSWQVRRRPEVLFGTVGVPVVQVRSQFYFYDPAGERLYRFTPHNLSLCRMEPTECELPLPD